MQLIAFMVLITLISEAADEHYSNVYCHKIQDDTFGRDSLGRAAALETETRSRFTTRYLEATQS